MTVRDNNLVDTVCSHCGNALKAIKSKNVQIFVCVNCKSAKASGESTDEFHKRFHEMNVDPLSTNFTSVFFNLKDERT
jgi:DNA-directed RNA polymerase subunit M/transcription elongation factor TFIIS